MIRAIRIFSSVAIGFFIPYAILWCFNHINPWVAFALGLAVISAIYSFIINKTNK
jgi:hypothetical protein